jgi:DTW domain-containing protein
MSCYCSMIKSFDPGIRFIILIQYREAQRHVATGRLSHLCLKNSELIEGYDYTNHPRVNELISDSRIYPLVLYPGESSFDLGRLKPEERKLFFPKGREPVIFVIDGTWTTARKTMQRSSNLAALPRISFSPGSPSQIRLRRQPKSHCLSTAEAIYRTIELIGRGEPGQENQLLEAFNGMIDQQISLTLNRPRQFSRAKTCIENPNSPN